MDRHYKVLKLQPGASLDEIKKAYRRAVRKWHPDLFPEGDIENQLKAHKMFRSISEAYSELKKRYQQEPWVGYEGGKRKYSGFENEPSERDGSDGSENFRYEKIQFISREWPNGDKYDGMVKNELPHGRGVFTYSNGDIYTGEFRFGKKQGEGKLTFAQGGQYVGGFVGDQMSGRGKLNFPNGDHYFGQFECDQFHGEGVLVANKKVYSGQWEYGGLL